MKPKTSPIWQYFIEVDGDYAKCKICDKNYSRKGRTTSSLKGHLKSMHKEHYNEFCKIDEGQQESENFDTSKMTEVWIAVTPLQQEKQIPLQGAVRNQTWDTPDAEGKEIDKLIGEMIALQNLPLSFVEGIGFRRLMKAALPNYELRGRQYFTDHVAEEIYARMANKIERLLTQFTQLSFTMDFWSKPRANVSLLSLTAHGITEDFQRMQIVLKCCPLHDGHDVCNHFEMMLQEWNIRNDKLHCLVRDGGSDMVRDVNLANIPEINCTVHQLQLCVRTALDEPDIKDLIAKCKEISTHFNHSQSLISQDELNQPTTRVIQDCTTGLDSTYYMVERLLKFKDLICLYSGKHNVPQISPEEWLHLNKIFTILGLFEEIIRTLSDTKTCISSIIPLIHVFKHSLRTEKEKSDTTDEFRVMITKIIADINCRFGELHDNNLFTLATYLDPRYKLRFFNEIVKKNVQTELLRLLTLYNDSNLRSGTLQTGDGAPACKKSRINTNIVKSEPGTSSQTVLPSIESQLVNILSNSSDDEDNDNDTTATQIWKSLVHEYEKEKRLQLTEDPLLWWKMTTRFYHFAPIARAYLSPPGSIPSQLFSGAGSIYNLRNHLEGDKAAKLLFIKYNLPLIDFDY